MALFKIFKGNSTEFNNGFNKPGAVTKEGNAYFVTTTGKFYIDVEDNVDIVPPNRIPINSDKADRFASERTITVTSTDTADPYINTATLSSDFNGNSDNVIELTVNRADKVTNSLAVNTYNVHGDTVKTQVYNGSSAVTVDIAPESLMPLTTINRSVHWADDSADDGWIDLNIKGDALPYNGSYVV